MIGSNKTIVITGSTRGIGFGLAEAFLARGCAVTVSGRTQVSVEQAVTKLATIADAAHIFGFACDVSDFSQVQALWNKTKEHYGRIDIWINNAGIANPLMDFWDLPVEMIHSVIETNVIGALYGSKVAIKGMVEQGSGALYNMEGYGSSGKPMTKGLALYGSTKAGLRFLNDSLMDEVKGKPVIVGAIRPGMVATDMLSEQYKDKPEEWERAKRIFNILAERVEVVAPWIAERVLANTQNGARLSFTSSGKMMIRFLLAPFQKRKVFD